MWHDLVSRALLIEIRRDPEKPDDASTFIPIFSKKEVRANLIEWTGSLRTALLRGHEPCMAGSSQA